MAKTNSSDDQTADELLAEYRKTHFKGCAVSPQAGLVEALAQRGATVGEIQEILSEKKLSTASWNVIKRHLLKTCKCTRG